MMTDMSWVLDTYQTHLMERLKLGIPPKPLSALQVAAVIQKLRESNSLVGEYIELITQRVPPGVDEAAHLKAIFLAEIATGKVTCVGLNNIQAIQLLGTMLGGYNVPFLVDLLGDASVASHAASALEQTFLIFDAFEQVQQSMQQGNVHARYVMESWAEATWFVAYPNVPPKITVIAFRVNGETNTDDLSPAVDAWSRSDIPLHALTMLKYPREGIIPDETGKIGPLRLIEQLKQQGYPLAYVGDVIGTGSSRKSATNSLVWHFGQTIPFVPNKRFGGVCLGGSIAPIFFNTQEDAGVLPIEANITAIKMGDVLDIYPYEGRIERAGVTIARFVLQSPMLLDAVRARGRINLILGRNLTKRAREALGLKRSTVFQLPPLPDNLLEKGYTLAQKIVGRACGLPNGKGMLPGSYCEPVVSTVGSQDTTGPMTQEELKDLACLHFSAELVMQSFCHTAAYPKTIDVTVQQTLSQFFKSRGGVALRPQDGIIHSWLNHLLLPDTVGTGADSHTRFPIGLSFPAGSGLVAFAAAVGKMPLDMPESVLVRFSGVQQLGITLRDLVHAIPFYAIQNGLLTTNKKNKKNIFSGRILEIEGLADLHIEQAFELSDASAERSAAACTIALSEKRIASYLRSNIALIRWMIAEGYQDANTLIRRMECMENWLQHPTLLKADHHATYAAVLDILLDDIKEPIVACPNDPDDVQLLSKVAGTKIDEVFIGSCMTNIGHYRAASYLLKNVVDIPTRLWIAPPTKMDAETLKQEGYYAILGRAGARIEVPGCSLCMGNQARARQGATVFSTSTRNFPNRLGQDTNVFLGSAELSAICAKLGYIPTLSEYRQHMQILQDKQNDIYGFMQFDQMAPYQYTT